MNEQEAVYTAQYMYAPFDASMLIDDLTAGTLDKLEVGIRLINKSKTK